MNAVSTEARVVEHVIEVTTGRSYAKYGWVDSPAWWVSCSCGYHNGGSAPTPTEAKEYGNAVAHAHLRGVRAA